MLDFVQAGKIIPPRAAWFSRPLAAARAPVQKGRVNFPKGEPVNDATDRRGSEPDPSLAEMVDSAVRRIATSVAIAGIAIALSIYARPGPPRYEAFATEGGIVRVDTRGGTVIGCEGGQCVTLVRRGQRLGPNPNIIGDDDDDDEPRPALPAPQPPSEKAAPAAAPPAAAPPTAAPVPAKQ
jgi:hypothetical protein